LTHPAVPPMTRLRHARALAGFQPSTWEVSEATHEELCVVIDRADRRFDAAMNAIEANDNPSYTARDNLFRMAAQAQDQAEVLRALLALRV